LDNKNLSGMYLLYCLFSTKLLIISQRWSPLQEKDYIGPNGKTLLISPQNLHRRLNPNCTGTVVVLIVWYLDLLLPMQAVTITTNVVSSNPAQTSCYIVTVETGVPGVNHRPAGSHWQTLSRNIEYTSSELDSNSQR
jgi:hypothetical protein